MNIVWVLVASQWAGIVLLMMCVAVIFDLQAAFSLGLGGLCYAIPTLIAVLFLKFLGKTPKSASTIFMVAESLKIILALILMIVVIWVYPSLQFLPFFMGLFFASHLIFLFFLKVHRYGK